MKIVVIADTHGRDLWKKQIEENADLYIFLGDYFDSPYIEGEDQIRNFLEIKDFYENNKDKVILLAGNHDLSYINFDCACSGFQNKYAWTIHNILRPMYENNDLKACKIINNYLFVHAGISKTWCENYNINVNNLEEEVNNLFSKEIFAFSFQPSPYINKLSYRNSSDPYGDNTWQSPMWIRPYSLMVDKLDNFIQIVGHTGHDDLTFKDNIWFIDCQETQEKPLILEI